MASVPLKSEFEYYLAHQAELVAKHAGKFIVVKGQKVIGVYDTEESALMETTKTHHMGTFLVQKCEAGEQNYTQHFHSRVAFA